MFLNTCTLKFRILILESKILQADVLRYFCAHHILGDM